MADCDPNTLAEASKCFGCLSVKQLSAILAYLLCQIEQNGGGGGGGGVTSFNSRTGAVTPQAGDYTTTIVAEGTNLYYTAARFNTAFAAKSTTDLAEGTNLYFTNTRAVDAIQQTTAVATTTGAVALSFTDNKFQTVALTGDPTFSTSNRATARFLSLRIDANGGARTLAFSASWKWIGTDYSAGISLASGKIAILSLTCYGSAETDVVAVYAVQP